MKLRVLAILCLATTVAAAPFPAPPVYAPPAPALGVTFEGGLGAGALAAIGPIGGDAVRGLAGPALGVGGFVTRRIALGVRLAGVTVVDHGTFFAGTLGPHAQLWLSDRAWLGGGVGLGMLAGCHGTCDVIKDVGIDARLGYAFAPAGTTASSLSVELTGVAPHAAGSSGPVLLTLSVLLGVQTF